MVKVGELRMNQEMPSGGVVQWSDVYNKPSQFPPEAHTHPELAPYFLSDTDTAQTPAHYGFQAGDGRWYVMRVDDTSARYAAGASGYTAAWADRANLSYTYAEIVF